MNYLGLDFDGDGFSAALANLILPSQWRVDDGYKAAQILGCNVIRSQTLGTNTGSTGTLYPTLGGAFDEDVFQVMDYAIARAADYGLHLIIPLTDWNTGYFWGDHSNFSEWGGADFFTDATAITNFKAYITAIINRVNTVNGLRYGDDPTIMAWETINEANAPHAWTTAIAAHIKSLTSQLVADGRWLSQYGSDIYSLFDPNVDIVMDHYYPMSITDMNAVLATLNLSNKVFIVTEYDWNSTFADGDTLANFTAAVEAADAVRGSLFYTLASHGDLKGWAASRNDYRGTNFPSGDDAGYGDPTIQANMDALRVHHYAMRGIAAPAYPAPDAPTITNSTGTFQWRGVAGAVSYTIQKSATQNGTYTDLATGLDDTDSPYTDAAGTAWYKICALNKGGTAGAYSAPVQVTFA